MQASDNFLLLPGPVVGRVACLWAELAGLVGGGSERSCQSGVCPGSSCLAPGLARGLEGLSTVLPQVLSKQAPPAWPPPLHFREKIPPSGAWRPGCITHALPGTVPSGETLPPPPWSQVSIGGCAGGQR